MAKISIKHRVLTTVDTSEVTLPFFYTTGGLSKNYCCMTADFKLISLRSRNGSISFDVTTYDDIEDAASSIDYDAKTDQFLIIDEAVFMHQFSVAHRELFYIVNPQLKPIE
jgi:hypothetical protein